MASRSLRPSTQNGASEVFGYPAAADTPAARAARANYTCPFLSDAVTTRWDIASLTQLLKKRIDEQETVFALDTPISEALGEIAPKLVHDKSNDQ